MFSKHEHNESDHPPIPPSPPGDHPQAPRPAPRDATPAAITLTPTDIEELMRNRFFLLGGGGGV